MCTSKCACLLLQAMSDILNLEKADATLARDGSAYLDQPRIRIP